MSRGTQTRYAPKEVPRFPSGRKPSRQPSNTASVPITLTGPVGGSGSTYEINVTPVASWVGLPVSLVNYGPVPITAIATVPSNRVTLSERVGGTGVTLTTEDGLVLIYGDGYKFDEVSYWTCALCGPNIAWRKKDLVRHPVTGQFVCKTDYDQLGVDQLESERGYRAASAGHLSEDFVAKSEWP